MSEDLFIPPIAPAYGSNDQELYRTWKTNPSKENMSKLVQALMPIINREVTRQSGSVATSVLRGTGMEWAIKAIKSYDDSKGVKLSTHVANYVQKIRRVNYTFQNAARLPENLQMEYGNFKVAKDDLSNELGRDPTEVELASRLGWKKHTVANLQKRLYQDVVESGSTQSTAVTGFNPNGVLLEMVRNSLDPQEVMVFDNQIKEKKDQLSNTDLAKKLGVNQNRLQYIRRKVVDKARALQVEMGSW
jgi:DNA-directed RNA polymerase specialized sigma subunit